MNNRIRFDVLRVTAAAGDVKWAPLAPHGSAGIGVTPGGRKGTTTGGCSSEGPAAAPRADISGGEEAGGGEGAKRSSV